MYAMHRVRKSKSELILSSLTGCLCTFSVRHLLLALGLNTCLKAVQTIAKYTEVNRCLSSAKDVFVFS